METEKVTPDQPKAETGVWVILEIFGHKVIAGYMSRDENLGVPMLRIDIPATDRFPAFTRHYHPNAVYSISYVSEEAARLAAEEVSENPISVYVPELGELARLQKENEQMRIALERMKKVMETPQLSDRTQLEREF